MHPAYELLIGVGITIPAIYAASLGVYAFSSKLSGASWRETTRLTLGTSRGMPNFLLQSLLHPKSSVEIDRYSGRVIRIITK